jgi:hypothetical protein
MKREANQINIIKTLNTSFGPKSHMGPDNVQSLVVSMVVIKSLPLKSKKTSEKSSGWYVLGILCYFLCFRHHLNMFYFSTSFNWLCTCQRQCLHVCKYIVVNALSIEYVISQTCFSHPSFSYLFIFVITPLKYKGN